GEVLAIDLAAMVEPPPQPRDLVRAPGALGRADGEREIFLHLAEQSRRKAGLVHPVIGLFGERLELGHPAQLVFGLPRLPCPVPTVRMRANPPGVTVNRSSSTTTQGVPGPRAPRDI